MRDDEEEEDGDDDNDDDKEEEEEETLAVRIYGCEQGGEGCVCVCVHGPVNARSHTSFFLLLLLLLLLLLTTSVPSTTQYTTYNLELQYSIMCLYSNVLGKSFAVQSLCLLLGVEKTKRINVCNIFPHFQAM